MTVGSWLLWGVFALAAFTVYRQSQKKGQIKLPPGPKPLPVLGNIKDFPPDGTAEHLHWLKHKDLYGGISSVTVMGMTLIIVHDKKMAHDLLDQTASKTSGRPSMVMANKLCGYEAIVICQGYSPMFRRYRKLLHQELGTKVSAAQFRDVLESEVSRQLIRALREPGRWLEHYKTNAAATVLQMAYGYTVESHKPDALVELTEKMMSEFSLAASPMAWVVDIIPILQYLPENIPGVSFKKTARRWRKSIQASAYIPYEFVQRQMATFTNRPSYVSKLVQQLGEGDDGKLSDEDEEAIIWTAASLYGAAADTSVITLTTFTLAMLKFPNVQSKAQEEIDRVIGYGHLPTFEDRERLPYINALVKEALRWWPIAPMNFPHTTTEAFEYDGYDIPKGSFILPSVWWFLHDPEVYTDPESFDPDRFLSPRNEPDPTTEAFGYGRRICPGRLFADSSLYINMVRTLATFDISMAVDEDGKEIEVDVKPKPGVLTYPTEFQFKATPRSDKHVELIHQLEKKHLFEPGDAVLLQSLDDFEVRY
ncbi:O-methylsterigmatocystin oxidoreductase [Colletotrichum tofieldiae]|uniref:O-methylsterigmatocystin oxidoreductase n=1 Tax=Colletotrichum tofieldiae TaxID=708197 RepID=A0A166S8F6_9PEZI|nr:O-methylsterigmatocystin oxidoreductase [Colletotrichum tofieldiae]GKT81516.1 O-methylsterigmatocystin oxidoreductase [Colletotrichum tofieldiae]